MTNQVSQLDLDAITLMFTNLLNFVKDFVFSLGSTIIAIITNPVVIGSLVTLAILYWLVRKATSRFHSGI